MFQEVAPGDRTHGVQTPGGSGGRILPRNILSIVISSTICQLWVNRWSIIHKLLVNFDNYYNYYCYNNWPIIDQCMMTLSFIIYCWGASCPPDPPGVEHRGFGQRARPPQKSTFIFFGRRARPPPTLTFIIINYRSIICQLSINYRSIVSQLSVDR